MGYGEVGEVVLEVERLSKKIRYPKLENFLEKLREYVSPDTPSYERRWQGMSADLIGLPRPAQLELLSIIEGPLQAWEESLGYRSNILTQQEHALFGSSGTFQAVDPYIPLCLIGANPPPIPEIIIARELERFRRASPRFFLLGNGYIIQNPPQMTLEPLGTDGRTLRDPEPVDQNLNVIGVYNCSIDFPFRRQARGNIQIPEKGKIYRVVQLYIDGVPIIRIGENPNMHHDILTKSLTEFGLEYLADEKEQGVKVPHITGQRYYVAGMGRCINKDGSCLYGDSSATYNNMQIDESHLNACQKFVPPDIKLRKVESVLARWTKE